MGQSCTFCMPNKTVIRFTQQQVITRFDSQRYHLHMMDKTVTMCQVSDASDENTSVEENTIPLLKYMCKMSIRSSSFLF